MKKQVFIDLFFHGATKAVDPPRSPHIQYPLQVASIQGSSRVFDKQQIIRNASYGGASGCGVELLKSKKVADKVAEQLWQNLRENNRSLERERIQVLPSRLYGGTWFVRYRCIPMGPLVPGAKGINDRRAAEITRAVKASYSEDDLVDSWTG